MTPQEFNTEARTLMEQARIQGWGGQETATGLTGAIALADGTRAPFTLTGGTLTIEGTTYPNITAWLDTRQASQKPAGDDETSEPDKHPSDA